MDINNNAASIKAQNALLDKLGISNASTAKAETKDELGQDEFLKLMTTQLQNQDPMNPMDNAAMTSQLAALNQVDGINKLNTSVNALVAQMQSANFMNLSSSVGKTGERCSPLHFCTQEQRVIWLFAQF